MTKNLFHFHLVCPPYSILDPERRLCVMSHEGLVQIDQQGAAELCKDFTWVEDGHLPIPKTVADLIDFRQEGHIRL